MPKTGLTEWMKGIDAVTCSVVDWVNVVGTNHDIDLED